MWHSVASVAAHCRAHRSGDPGGGGTEKPGCRAAAIAHPASTARVDNTVLKELLLLHICTASIFAGGEPHCSGRPRGPLLRTRSCTVENLHIFAILDYDV